MVVNTIMEIGKRKGIAMSSKTGSRATVVNLSGDAMRRHERAMEYRHQAEVGRANLDSAMKALEAANADIVRLNEELTYSNAEIYSLRMQVAELNAKLEQMEKAETAVDPEGPKVEKASKPRRTRQRKMISDEMTPPQE